MSLVDIAILILKLIVAALQLLDAVLKYVKGRVTLRSPFTFSLVLVSCQCVTFL